RPTGGRPARRPDAHAFVSRPPFRAAERRSLPANALRTRARADPRHIIYREDGMGHLRWAAPALAGLLLGAAGCGDDDNGGGTPGPTRTPTVAAATVTPGGPTVTPTATALP